MKTTKVLGRIGLGMALLSFAGIGAVAQTSGQSPQNNPMSNQGRDMSGSNTLATSASSGPAMSDEHFLKKAAQGGMAEVELGKLAEQKASNPEVKKFAERMVTDHTKANDQLKQVASAKGITPPQSLDAKDAATKRKLESLSGQQFDQAYMKDMVTDHTKDVTDFKRESVDAKDPNVKNFASQTLPTLESHLKEARQIAPQVMDSSMGK